MNEELIQSAVSFLKDPNVANSPLNKKVEFLQSKGLNELEIEEALNRANSKEVSNYTSYAGATGAGAGAGAGAAGGAPVDYYNVNPPVPERTWKDYFIMATATAGVTYGIYQVVSKYVIPTLIPPTQTSIDEDKKQIDEEFVKIDKLLEQLANEQKEIKQSNEEKLKEIDTVINNINDFLAKYNKDKLTFDDDLRLMKLEIDNLQNSVEKSMSLTKDNLKDDLSDINEEIASLKNLIKIRSSKEDRKIAPVSSIPSVKDILKKKAESAPAAPAAPVAPAAPAAAASPPADSPPAASPAPSPAPSASSASPAPSTSPGSKTGVRFEEPSPATTFNGVSAAGIPEWQLKHKEEEEKINSTINKVGVPAWQLNQS